MDEMIDDEEVPARTELDLLHEAFWSPWLIISMPVELVY